MLIYMATNRITGKEYIGQSVRSLTHRKSQHLSSALTNTGNTYFCNTIRKYGQYNFDWEILHDGITDIDDLNKLEMYYIKLYDTFNNGYNLTEGGGGMLGLVPNKDTRLKMSQAKCGTKLKEKHKQRIKKTMVGRNSGKDNPFYGGKHNGESLKKISSAQTGKKNHRAHAVIVHGEHFDTLTEAAIVLHTTIKTISYRIKNNFVGYKHVTDTRGK